MGARQYEFCLLLWGKWTNIPPEKKFINRTLKKITVTEITIPEPDSSVTNPHHK